MTNYARLRNFYNSIAFHQQEGLPEVQFISLHQWDSRIDDGLRPHTTAEWMQHFVNETFDNVFVIRDGKVFDVLNDRNINWSVEEFNQTYCTVEKDEEYWGTYQEGNQFY
jgi:hypothetical protein